jgi:glycine/D-amino acid oxidase-like deaminating enzyme
MTAPTRTAPAFWFLLAALLAGAYQTSCNRSHTQDIETLRKAYAAFNRGDIPAAVEAMDPNVEWTEPYRGFKIAGHTLGDNYDPAHPWDPDRADRVRFQAPRDYLALRFPFLKDAPLVESFVCQYEMSPDENYILSRHPGGDNVWFAGGGSGHGFKAGPAVGELMADLVEGKKSELPFFSLSRFRKLSAAAKREAL